jgi:conjugal transfer pilus assembly protein TraV
MRASPLLILPAALALAGCASMGGNVKGNFICRAPDGICSPTSNIDDQAIASMMGGAAAGAAASPIAANAPVANSAASLKVVLPARTDRFGRWRDETVVYVEPQLAAGHPADRQLAGAGAVIPARLSLVELAAGAPAPAELASVSQPTSAKPITGELFRAEVERRLSATRKGPEPVEVPPSDAATAPAIAATAQGDTVVTAPGLGGQPAPDGN